MASKTFNHSFDKIFSSCLKALKNLDFKVTSKSKDSGQIIAESGTTLLSWGETIEIRLEEVSIQKTKLFITSEATAQLFSWGKNEANITKVMDEVKDILRT